MPVVVAYVPKSDGRREVNWKCFGGTTKNKYPRLKQALQTHV